VDRSALPAPAATGATTGAATAAAGSRTPPRTAAERLVEGLWRELFDVGDISVDDDFFRLGGSSLQFTRLANRLREATGKDIELRRLLSATTVAAQARLIGGSSADAHRVRPVARTGALPVSFGQRRLWVLDRMRPGDREWISGLFLRLPADVGVPMVRQALDALVDRHEAFRTRFTTEAGEPVQIIDPPVPMELRTIVLSEHPSGSAAEDGVAGDAGDADRAGDGTGRELSRELERELDRGFDLDRGPLVRGLLARRRDPGPAGEQVLVLLMHHIICDGWSSALLDREFNEILAALRRGEPAALPPLEVQYADYAAWQREQLTEEALEEELRHWRTVLDGAVPLALRTDRPRHAARDAHGAAVNFTVPASVTHALTQLGRRHDATPFMTLVTGFAALLARYTAQWDVVIGTPVAGRGRPEVEGVVGFFLNSLVLRCSLDGALAFDQALETVRDACRTAFAHQELPFERLVADLVPDRDLSRTPLYQVAFDLHDETLTGSAADLTDLSTLLGVSRVAKTDLTLYLRRQPDGTMIGGLEYATALFDRSTIERMARHFVRLLESVTRESGTRLDALDFLPADEVRALSRWNHTPAAPVPASVLDMFEQKAAELPHAVAVVAADSEVPGATAQSSTAQSSTAQLSMAQLDERANRMAHHLRRMGVGPESVVGVLLDRGVDLLTCLLGVWKAGAAYLPLDPGFPADRVGFAVTDSGARVVVTQSAYRDRLPAIPLVLTDVDAERIAAAPAGPVGRPADLDLLAYVIYTSGSTGRPKGVQVTHRGLANHLSWAVAELATRGAGGAPVFSSIAFDLVVPNLWAPLLAGRPVHMLPQDLDLAELGRRLTDAGPFGFIKLTPGHLEILSEQLPAERLAALAEVIVVAGEALPVRSASEWARALGDDRLINEYGPTEASVGTCVFPVAAPVTRDSVPIGRPLPGVTMYVLDVGLRPAPVGIAGEIYVGGAGVARGYVARPGLTAERFMPDPYGPPGARIYRTGDLARVLPDGNVDFIGRLDDQVKIRGYRVELGEIKCVVVAHPAVRDAVVIAETDAAGSTSVAAYYVPAAGAAADGGAADDGATDDGAAGGRPAEPGSPSPSPRNLAETLAAHCAAQLPDYMIPSTFTPIGSIPLSANGKLDRRALPRPEKVPAVGLVTPRSLAEQRIAEIFTELLGTQAGANSHFFRDGGNSILAIRLIAAIQAAFEVDLRIRAVFEGPTVAELAEAVEAVVRAEINDLPDVQLVADVLLSRDQH
jgi:amino acid adenylation domain-containing protein